MWIRAAGAFVPVVSTEDFFTVQGIIRERSRRFTDDELLNHLRKLLDREGRLSGLLIDETEGMASSSVYRGRFNSLVRAYQLIGYTPDRDYQFLETNRQLRLMHPKVVDDAIARMRQLGGMVIVDPTTDILTVNHEFTASLVISRCRQTETGGFRWLIRLDSGLKPDITVAIRMDAENREPFDYYLLPSIDLAMGKLTLSEDNGVSLDTYRFNTLDYFFGMARRAKIPEAA
jgi:hypothetical protein